MPYKFNVFTGNLDLVNSASPFYLEYHVNPTYTGSGSTGSYNQPFMTIQAAVNAAQAFGAVNAIIFLHGQGTTENVIINNYGFNLLITAFAPTPKDNQTFQLNGNITISGLSTRIRLKDFQIRYPGGTQPDLIDSSSGRIYLSNVDFAGGGGIQYTGSWLRWHEYVDCTINGNVDIGGTPAAGSQISMWRTRGAPTIGLNSSNVTLLLVDSENLGTITHTSGNLDIEGGEGFATSPAIISSANTPDTLTLSNVNLRMSGTTFARINKTGTATYALNNVWRNESIDILSGTRLTYGSTAADQTYIPSTPSNWLITPSDTKDALDYLASQAFVSGSLRTITTSSTLLSTDKYILVNGSSPVTITLPIVPSSQLFNIKNISSNNVTITPTSGTIDGSSSIPLNVQYTALTIITDSTNWWIF